MRFKNLVCHESGDVTFSPSFIVLAQLGRFAYQFASCKLAGNVVVPSTLAHYFGHHFPPFAAIFPLFPTISISIFNH